MFGRTAAVGGNGKIAAQLIRAGADVNVVDNNGKTPLMLAVINGYQSLVEVLLDNNADVSVKNEVWALHETFVNQWRTHADRWLGSGFKFKPLHCAYVSVFVPYARPQFWADLHEIWYVASSYPLDVHGWVRERRLSPPARAQHVQIGRRNWSSAVTHYLISSFHFYHWNQFKVITYSTRKPPQIFCDVRSGLTTRQTTLTSHSHRGRTTRKNREHDRENLKT